MKKDILHGNGEMSELTREKDWSKTSLGDPETWDKSLTISLNILLNSKFPMFLWWGPELLCFYNDAYRPSLGKEGKHPQILGMNAKEAWSEIWDIIKPLIDKVIEHGESVWYEDRLVPIYRNGKIEDVYWTFSYSPVHNDAGNIGGVLVTCTETTEKVLIKKQLEESERKLRVSMLQAPVSIAIFRGAQYITEIVNGRALELWGRKEEDVINRPILEAMPELEDQGIKKLLDDVYYTGIRFSAAEHPVQIFRHGRFEKVYVNFSYEPLYDAKGNIEGIMTVGVDVTHQVLAHKMIQTNEEKLNVVIDASELGTFELNLATDSIEYSDKLLEIFGHTAGEKLMHVALLDHLHPDDLAVHEKAYEAAYQSGILHYEARIILHDNSIRWIEVKGKVFYDIIERPYLLIGTLRDISEIKRQQQILFESEQKFRLLADSMPQNIWTADPQGNLYYYNKSVFDYSGLTLEQFNADGWLQIVHPHDREENIKTWMHSITTGSDFLFEHRFRRHDGVYRWQLSRAVPQRDKDGKIQMWVGTSTDIEDQKSFSFELEKLVDERTKKLEENYIELEKMNKELESFAYISSHDLQEPLRKIQTFAGQIMEKEFDSLSENGKNKFQRMLNAAERMQRLIDDLLVYSRTNTSERKFERTDLDKIITEVKEELKEEISEKNATIESDSLCEINIIPFQFRQMMLNLIGNSLKFSKPGFLPHIKITGKIVPGNELDSGFFSTDKNYCHIAVTDNGIGFEPEYSERIFEVFQRLHQRHVYTGTGIGLAIVKKIVENHNGIITAKATLNEGATFDIYIPS